MVFAIKVSQRVVLRRHTYLKVCRSQKTKKLEAPSCLKMAPSLIAEIRNDKGRR